MWWLLDWQNLLVSNPRNGGCLNLGCASVVDGGDVCCGGNRRLQKEVRVRFDGANY